MVSAAKVDRISFVIWGAPRTKKTSNRVVRSGNRIKVLPSAAFEAWNNTAQFWLRKVASDNELETIQYPVNCCATFYRDAERGDAVGYYQALADALKDARIVHDDVLVVSWDGSRLAKDAKDPRIEVTLEAV